MDDVMNTSACYHDCHAAWLALRRSRWRDARLHPFISIKYETRFRANDFSSYVRGIYMMYFFIFTGVIVLYFGIRVWIGSRKMEFYGDSIKNNSRDAREKAYEKSAQHAQQLRNNSNQNGSGGGPMG